jgi:hypothetical protein
VSQPGVIGQGGVPNFTLADSAHGFWFSTLFGVRLVCFTLSCLAVFNLSQALILSSEKLGNLLCQITLVVFT